jgi:GTPase
VSVDQPFRSGFVAVVGRPNVGKSTLINALVGSKVSIVTPKPQTTRHRILGVRNEAHAQAIFIDTPGLHRNARKAMNRLMNRAADNAIRDADLILCLSEANRWTADDALVLERVRSAASSPVIAVINKIDKVHPREELLRVIADTSARYDFAEVIPVSALKKDNLERLIAVIPHRLPESPPLFPATMVSDRGDSFRAAELIREKLTLALHQEVPYGLTVEIERFLQEADGLVIGAVVWVERESQKGIVVGKGGLLLKKVGRAARLELKERYRMPVHVDLWVKVRDNWADSEEQLSRLGYE